MLKNAIFILWRDALVARVTNELNVRNLVSLHVSTHPCITLCSQSRLAFLSASTGPPFKVLFPFGHGITLCFQLTLLSLSDSTRTPNFKLRMFPLDTCITFRFHSSLEFQITYCFQLTLAWLSASTSTWLFFDPFDPWTAPYFHWTLYYFLVFSRNLYHFLFSIEQYIILYLQ